MTNRQIVLRIILLLLTSMGTAMTFAVSSGAQTIVGGQQDSVPRVIGYQGMLLEKNNRPKPDGQYFFRFSLCDHADCSDPAILLNTDTLSVKNGGFSTILHVPNSISFAYSWWLHIDVTAPGGQQESLEPNMLLSTAAYSFISDSARKAHRADTSILSGVADSSHHARYADSAYNGLPPGAANGQTIRWNADINKWLIAPPIIPVGTVMAYAGDTLLSQDSLAGWLLCDGRQVKNSDYPLLYAAIHTAQGESGGSFWLPDYRGLFLRGANSTPMMGNRTDAFADPDTDPSYRLSPHPGIVPGGNRVGSVQADMLRAHHHTFPGNSELSAPAASVYQPGGENSLTNGATQTNDYGGNETRPKNAYVNWIIKAKP